jgi:hypothetical protein
MHYAEPPSADIPILIFLSSAVAGLFCFGWIMHSMMQPTVLTNAALAGIEAHQRSPVLLSSLQPHGEETEGLLRWPGKRTPSKASRSPHSNRARHHRFISQTSQGKARPGANPSARSGRSKELVGVRAPAPRRHATVFARARLLVLVGQRISGCLGHVGSRT